MKYKNIKLEWYAFYQDFNSSNLISVNILGNDLKEEIYKKIKSKKIKNKNELYECVNNYCMYHYWSKSEFEVIVGGLCDTDIEKFHKIDVYFQLKPNMNRIVEYIIKEMDINFMEELK